MKVLPLFLALSFSLCAEVKTLTLREALAIALGQNPDVMLARLDQQKARDQVIIERDAFVPKVFAGSGAAWTSGYPNAIDGNAPAIIEAKTQMYLFNRPQSWLVARATELARGTEIDLVRRQDEVAYRVAALFLDADQAAQSLAAVEHESVNLARVKELVDARVSEGHEFAIESKKADLSVKRAKRLIEDYTLNLAAAEMTLAQVLGLAPGDRVHAASGERPALSVPVSREAALEAALDHSPEIKRLESDMQAKMLEVKSYRSMWMPKISLVAQYSLFSKFTYQDYFTKFQRNNGQLGAAFEIPVLVGRAAHAYASQADAEAGKIRVELARARSKITADIERGFQEIKRAESAREYAQTDLDVAREDLSMKLAQYNEGRLLMAVVESARAIENEKWLALYDSQFALERARLNVLRDTGTLLAALR